MVARKRMGRESSGAGSKRDREEGEEGERAEAEEGRAPCDHWRDGGGGTQEGGEEVESPRDD